MPELINLNKIKSLEDIQQLKVGMSIYKYLLNGNPGEGIDPDASNYNVLIINEIGDDHIVLVSDDQLFYNSLPIAKEFDRLIEDGLWWYPMNAA